MKTQVLVPQEITQPWKYYILVVGSQFWKYGLKCVNETLLFCFAFQVLSLNLAVSHVLFHKRCINIERDRGRLEYVMEILIDCLTIIWQADSVLIIIVINDYQQ